MSGTDEKLRLEDLNREKLKDIIQDLEPDYNFVGDRHIGYAVSLDPPVWFKNTGIVLVHVKQTDFSDMDELVDLVWDKLMVRRDEILGKFEKKTEKQKFREKVKRKTEQLVEKLGLEEVG